MRSSLETIRARGHALFTSYFQMYDALAYVRERIADEGIDIYRVSAEVSFLQEAVTHVFTAIDGEIKRYNDNLKILLQEYDKKLLDHVVTATATGKQPREVPPEVILDEQNLRDAFGAMEDVEFHEGYDVELTRYWRRYGRWTEARKYENLWVWVVGRRMPQLD